MSKNILVAAGLLLAASAAFAQQPNVTVQGGGAKAGSDATVKFIVSQPENNKVAAVTFVLTLPTGADAVVGLPATPSGTAPAGFDPPAITSTTIDGKTAWVYFSGTPSGMGIAGSTLEFTMKVNQKGTGLQGAKLELIPFNPGTGQGSNLATENLETFSIAGVVPIVNGASRALNGAMNNAVSVTLNRIAAVAGSTLWVLDATTDDLAPVAGIATGVALASTTSGRPAFGAVDGALAVAVGQDDGTLTVANAETGAKVDYKDALTSATTPAIAGGGVVYVAGKTATGTSVVSVKVAGGAAVLSSSAALTGTDVQSSPAVAGNTLVVGTNDAVFYANVDANGVITPRTNTAPTGVNFNTSPVVSNGFAFIGDAVGKVHKINIANGDATVSTATVPVPLSDPFAQGGKVHFGAGDGTVATFAGGDVAAAPTFTTVGTTPVVSPVDSGALVVAGTQAGIVMAGATSVDLGPTLGKAVALIPGTTPTIVVNKVDGTVYAMPAQ